jgi:DNA helicase MCM9
MGLTSPDGTPLASHVTVVKQQGSFLSIIPKVRLAQAHAKLMCKGEATLSDAVVAVIVMESSMQGAALLGSFSPLHSAFPLDAEAEYTRQEAHVLDRLGLFHLRRFEPRGQAEARSEPPLGQAAAAAAAPSLDNGHARGNGTDISPNRPISSSVEQPGHAGHALLSQRPHRPRARYEHIWKNQESSLNGSCALTPLAFLFP